MRFHFVITCTAYNVNLRVQKQSSASIPIEKFYSSFIKRFLYYSIEVRVIVRAIHE